MSEFNLKLNKIWICLKINRCKLNQSIYLVHTQIFQAFQFGFGCDTSAKQAGVIVTLQQNAQKIHFFHSKSIGSNHKYSIKIDGVDAGYRVNKFDQSINQSINFILFKS